MSNRAEIAESHFGLPSKGFAPLRYGLGAWTEHIFFAYDLVAELRPRLLVELGTDRGESYFAFCQSVKENVTGTRCFAVDHWRGDAHSGSYDEATYDDVAAHNRAHYAGFSTLLRAGFDEALDQFAPESIDLLHLDGHHTEAAVRHDLESWLPKLRPGGLLLLHDIAVKVRDFGVWKVWAELETEGRAFAFPTPPGLGVWQKPPAEKLPPFLETLWASPNELKTYYRDRAAALQETIAEQWRDGSIRSAPMASETVIQVFWRGSEGFAEERSSDCRVGHGTWKDVSIPLPTEEAVRALRIDFFSALTTIELSEIAVEKGNGETCYLACRGEDFAAISLAGDCLRVSLEPFRIRVTGVDPQLYPPELPQPVPAGGLIVRLRLRVL